MINIKAIKKETFIYIFKDFTSVNIFLHLNNLRQIIYFYYLIFNLNLVL